MSSITPNVNATVAPLKNVALMMGLVQRLQDRKPHLPGIGVLHGFSGYGKSIATTYAANKLRSRAVYVEARSTWTKKKFHQAILQELAPGNSYRSTPVYEMTEIVAEKLMVNRIVLFIDEADHVVDRGFIESVRDIYDIAKTPIVLIGEEKLPPKLERYERVDNRILEKVPAQPCDIEDARHLASMYCDQIRVADDLLQRLVDAVRGCTRRVAANLDDIQEEALRRGWETVDVKCWGERSFNTGAAHIRRGQ